MPTPGRSQHGYSESQLHDISCIRMHSAAGHRRSLPYVLRSMSPPVLVSSPDYMPDSVVHGAATPNARHEQQLRS